MLSYVYTSMFPLHCLLNNSLFARRHPIIEPRCADAAADLRDTSSENFELRKNVETFSDVIIAEVLTQSLVLNLTQSTMSCLFVESSCFITTTYSYIILYSLGPDRLSL